MPLSTRLIEEFFEERASKEIAINMLNHGLDTIMIARVLDKPIEWVEEIKHSQEAAIV